MANPVNHFEICVTNRDKGKEFYGNLFGWKFNDIEGMNYSGVTAEEGGIGGGIMEPPEEGVPPYVTFYITVVDINACLTKVEEYGGKTIVPKTPIPGMGHFAMFTDPDGNHLGIYQDGQ